MALTSQQLAKELETMVAKRRAFWEHPWIHKFRRAELSKEQVRHWIEQQFYLTGRVHDLIGPLYINCEDARRGSTFWTTSSRKRRGGCPRALRTPNCTSGWGVRWGARGRPCATFGHCRSQWRCARGGFGWWRTGPLPRGWRQSASPRRRKCPGPGWSSPVFWRSIIA